MSAFVPQSGDYGATAPKAFGAGGKGIRTPDFQLAKLALYQLSYAPMTKGESNWLRVQKKATAIRISLSSKAPPRRVHSTSDSVCHQIRTRCSGAMNIVSTGWTLKASYQASVFRVGPITRN